MDELKQQFYEVMHKYQKPFSAEGVTANLTQWYEQKQGLLQLLRKQTAAPAIVSIIERTAAAILFLFIYAPPINSAYTSMYHSNKSR